MRITHSRAANPAECRAGRKQVHERNYGGLEYACLSKEAATASSRQLLLH